MTKSKSKLFNRPRKTYDSVRIKSEHQLAKKYGLKSMREIWKADFAISGIRNRAKKLITADVEQQEKFIEMQKKKGFKVESITDILALNKEDYLKRILQIGEKLDKIIAEYRPDGLAIEKLFLTKNQKTALKVAEVKGVIIYLAAKANISCFEFTPLEIKSAICGYGKADKKQVQNALKFTLKNFISPKSDDVCDAIAVSLTCFFHTNSH